MSVTITTGDLFVDPAEAWVNAVNCVGVMNAGIAKMFRHKFPLYYLDYHTKCQDGLLRTGSVDAYSLPMITNQLSPKFIISFPTMLNPGEATQETELADGLRDLVRLCDYLSLIDIAIPALGCGIGQFEFPQLQEMVEIEFVNSVTQVRLYRPYNWRAAQTP